jgi:hypothetical protein
LVETGLYNDLLKIEVGILTAIRIAEENQLESQVELLNDALRECRKQLELASRDRPTP